MGDDSKTRRLVKLDMLDTLPAGAAAMRGDAVSATDELVFGGRLGRYLVLEPLGRGGMGVVYAAYDPVLDRRIAIKLLVGGLEEQDVSAGHARMHREAQALARLSHANVITVHDVGERDGGMYIAMELVDGTTLREWQKQRDWREVLAAYLAAARGLAAAHAAGIVHRDFKPDNVLIGADGRVRVTDFGLARRAADPVDPHAASAANPRANRATTPVAFASDLTEAGAVMGTLAYMAPEQIDGGAIDERSDQFSWCIAVWEAIFGEQPFIAGTIELRGAAMKTDIPKPPAATKVPRAVTRALLRGLSPDAAQRWPSMDALAGAIERALSSRRLVIGGSVAAAAAVIAAVFAAGRAGGARREQLTSCDGAGDAIAATWTPAARTAIDRAFTQTGAPFAHDAAAAATRAIDTWRERWQAVAVGSCTATRSGLQSAQALDLRADCLARKRDELATTLAALARADRNTVTATAQLALPDLDSCNDATALAGVVPPPRDTAARARIEAQLAAIEQELGAGVSIERAQQLLATMTAPTTGPIAAAETLAWPPLTARARTDLAKLDRELGKGKDARGALLAAAADASAAGDRDALVEAYLGLAGVEAVLTSDFALGDSWVALAAGTLTRVGARPSKQLAVMQARGLVADHAGHPDAARKAYAAALPLAQMLGEPTELGALADLGRIETTVGDLKSARQHFARAQDLARRELGTKHPMLGRIDHDLGVVAYREGHYAASRELFTTALAIRQAAFGPDSVEVARTIEAIGNVDVMIDHVDDARREFDQALAIYKARLGPEHPDVAEALNDIGGTYHRAGRYQDALDSNLHVLALRERTLGPDHPDVAESLVNVAIEAKNLGKWSYVDTNYPRALAIYEKTYGADSFEVAVTLINLGEARRAQGNLDAAQAAYERCRDIFSKRFGEDDPMLAHVWNGLGQVELARGNAGAAVELLERAVAMREKSPSDATDLAESRFALARALPATAAARATQLATAARDVYRDAGPGYAARATAVDAWLAHRT